MTSRLQLHLSARDLKNISGLMGVSDPFAVVTVRGDSEDNAPRVVGQTEVVFNNLSPSWSRVIFLDGYRFGVPLYFEVGVFDFEASTTGKTELELSRMDVHEQAELTAKAATATEGQAKKFPHKVMGTALFEVGQVLGNRGNVASKSLQQNSGILTVHVERCKSERGSGRLFLHLHGKKIKSAGTFSSSNPFYELFRKVDRPSGAVSWESVYRSNTAKGTITPEWNSVLLDLDATCNGDIDRAIKLVVWDHKRNGRHKYMGECETTVRGFVTQKQQKDDLGFELMKDGKPVGRLQVVDAKLTLTNAPDTPLEAAASSSNGSNGKKNGSLVQGGNRPEFVDYLSGGCQISLAVAIDFTASNGDPREPGTPHYFHPPQSKEWNDYEKAIFAVGSILAKYDSDQRMPVWGFGAKYNGVVRHCFQCGPEVEVEGVQGIMDAYRGVFRTPLTMSYPTKLTEVIETAASYARHEQELAEKDKQLSYTILLILTSGNVEDANETKECLIEASEDPLSVVIVGIGDADFTTMEFLDDHDPETQEGRHITKFVRFADFRSFNALTEAVLEEIPHQLVDYFYSRDILPRQQEGFDEKNVRVQDADDDDRTLTFLG